MAFTNQSMAGIAFAAYQVGLEEQAICFADKFYSKTHLEKEKSVEKARKSLERYGEEGVRRFDNWCEQFL